MFCKLGRHRRRVLRSCPRICPLTNKHRQRTVPEGCDPMPLSFATLPRNHGPGSARASSRLRVAVSELFRAPFTVDPEAVFNYTPAKRDRLRRARILRLFVTCLTVILALWLPLVLSDHALIHVIVPQVLAVLLGILCLILNQSGRTTASALLYVYGMIALIGIGALSGAPMI